MTPLGVILVLGQSGSLSLFPIPFSLADDSYQVVFEDVGQVATSVCYLHLAVDLHFPEVKSQKARRQWPDETTPATIEGSGESVRPISFFP